MKIKDFMSKYDAGSWFAIGGNRKISDSEVKTAGGYEQMAKDYQALSPSEQSAVRDAIKDKAVRKKLDGWADPRVARAIEAADQGSEHLGGWVKSGRQDGRLSKDELENHSGALHERLRGLNSDERVRIVEHIDDDALATTEGKSLARLIPEAFDPLAFGNAHATEPEAQEKIAKVKTFLVEKLGLNPAEVAEGFEAKHLAEFPVRQPATPEERFVAELRQKLAVDSPLNIFAFHDFLAANFPKLPEVSVAELSAALAAEPQRFVGKSLTLTGYAEHVKVDYSGYYSITPYYDDNLKMTRMRTDDTRSTRTEHHFRDAKDLSGPSITVISDHSGHYDDIQNAAELEGTIEPGTVMGRFALTGRVTERDGNYELEWYGSNSLKRLSER